MKRTIYYILAFALCSCAVQKPTTSDEFAKDVQKDLPFKVNELKPVSNHDNTYSFHSDGYIGLLPDYEVDSEGASMIYQTTFAPPHDKQPTNVIWRTSSSINGINVSSVSTVSLRTTERSDMSMCCNRRRRGTATPALSIGM